MKTTEKVKSLDSYQPKKITCLNFSIIIAVINNFYST